eukprot:tig00000802_g4267.t1
MPRTIAPVPSGGAGGLGSIGQGPLGGESGVAPLDLGLGAAKDPGLGASGRLSTEPSMVSLRMRPDRRKGRGSAERRRRMSLRWLFVLLSILYITVATAVTWAVTYVFALRNIRDVTAALLDEARESAVQSVTGYISAAQNINHRTRSGFESGLLTKAAWRKTLEYITASVGSFPEVGAVTAAVRFADSTILGIRNCRRGGLHGCTDPDVFTSNGTHFNFYAGSDRGQPLAWRAAEPAPTTLSGMYGEVAASAGLANWHELATLRVSVANWGPLNRIAFEYGTGIRLRPAPEQLGLAVSVGVGALSAFLRGTRLARDGVVLVTTPAGAMVATSTDDPAHLVDPAGKAVLASESPSPLIRALVSEAMARPAPGRSSFLTLSAEGRVYYFSRASVSFEPNLSWNIVLAVREEAVLAQISSSITVISCANAAWLVVSVAAAVFAGLRVTRPLAELHSSLSVVLETLTGMTRELRAHLVESSRRGSLVSSTASISDAGGGPHESGGEEPGPDSKPPSLREASPAAPALASSFSELARFEPLLARVHSRFSSFAGLLSRENQARVETRARAEAVSKFLSTMSHEMRTPLNGILGMLELASDFELPGEAAGYLAAASRCGEHLLFIVSDLLDFQRMEAGALALRQVALDVREVLASALKMLEVQSEAKGVAIRATVDPGVPAALLSDPNRLRQVLLNLIGNALKYSPAGSGAILVRAAVDPSATAAAAAAAGRPSVERARRAGGGRSGSSARDGPVSPGGKKAGAGPPVVLRFEVVDSGLGIPPEDQALLFSPFFRARVAEGGHDPGGTGLGLAICKDLVQGAGGAIGARGGPAGAAGPGGAGPAGGGAPAAAGVALGRLAAGAAAPPSGRRVLVVEGAPSPLRRPLPPLSRRPADDEVTQRVVAQTLKRAGHAALVARHGAEAVELFGRAAEAAPRGARAFDCIFMDCSMPVLDGYRATEAIRALEAARGLPRHPIVAFTAHGDADDEDLCRRAGMDLFLIKPVRRAALLAKLDEALRGQRPPGPAPEPAPSLDPAPAPLEPVPAPQSLPRPPRRLKAKAGAAPDEEAAAAERTVLVVDDVEMNRRVLVGLARREGLPVETAGDGEEAVAAFSARAAAGRRFSLILMDIQMPKMDGRQAAARIRELEREAGLAAPLATPIVACTAFSDRGASLESGMNDHLQKPVTRAALLPVLRRYCPGLEAPAAPASAPASAPAPSEAAAGAPAASAAAAPA